MAPLARRERGSAAPAHWTRRARRLRGSGALSELGAAVGVADDEHVGEAAEQAALDHAGDRVDLALEAACVADAGSEAAVEDLVAVVGPRDRAVLGEAQLRL